MWLILTLCTNLVYPGWLCSKDTKQCFRYKSECVKNCKFEEKAWQTSWSHETETASFTTQEKCEQFRKSSKFRTKVCILQY